MNPRHLAGDDMSCRELVELLTDYLEGALPAPQKARLEAHLEECPGCTEYLAQMRLTLRLSGSVAADAILPGDRERLLHTFRNWMSDR